VAVVSCADAWPGAAVAERHVTDERLSAFLDDELEEESALRVTRHLAGCDACLEELEELRATRDALRRLPSLQAPVLTAEIRPDRSTVRRVSRTAMFTGAMTVVAVMFGGAVYVVGGDDGDVVPPMEMFLVDHVARTGGGPVPPSVGDHGR
jgi:anti-sigma factor RsiW